jgi:hypothetical protein
MSGVQNPYRLTYKTVAASATEQVLGTAKGDFLQRIIATVTSASTATVTLIDGATSIQIVPSPVASTGVIVIELGIASVSTGWKVTTGAGVSVLAVGIFSA